MLRRKESLAKSMVDVIQPSDLSWELIPASEEKTAPSARTYFSLVSHSGVLWFFGGFGEKTGRHVFNDLVTFNPNDGGSWDVKPQLGECPDPIYLHSAVAHDSRMWVFGGSIGRESSKRLYCYDFASNNWSLVKCAGDPPRARYGHAVCVRSGKMIVTGGCFRTSEYLQDTHAYDFETRTWEQYGGMPIDMAYHTLWEYNNEVFLFGGYNGVAFNPHCYRLINIDGLKTWVMVQTSGRSPPPRCGSATAVVKNFLYVFGGFTEAGHTNALFRLDLDRYHWETLAPRSSPQPRAYLQSAMLTGHLYIFGGYNGRACVKDFKRIRLLDTNINMARVIMEEKSVKRQVQLALDSFSSGAGGGGGVTLFSSSSSLGGDTGAGGVGVLTAGELEFMFANIKLHLPAVVNSSKVRAHAFDPAVVAQCVGMSFSHDQVIECLSLMRKEGKDCKNVNLVLDRLMTMPDAEAVPEVPPALQFQHSAEKSKLRDELSQAKEENADLRSCKICFSRDMDCVLEPCNHLIMCSLCAASLAKRHGPGHGECPVCRNNITGNIKIFWG